MFIKDYNNLADSVVRQKHGMLASIGGLVVNTILFTFKMLIGLFTLSLSIISDALNNLTDFFSCIVNIIGFKIAGKPADKEHPFGHERIEYIAGVILAIFVIVMALILGYNSVQSLINHSTIASYNMWAVLILGVSVPVKILLGVYYYKMGKLIDSTCLKASMKDSIYDAITTSVVLVGIVIQMYNPSLWWIDLVVTLGLAIFILQAGVKLVIEASSPLLGTPADADFVKEIVGDILSHEGVLGIHDVVCHMYGPSKIFMIVHIEVDGYDDIFKVHELIDSLELEISKKYGIIITAHMDPIDTKSRELKLLKSEIKQVLHKIDEKLNCHDMRVVKGENNTNVIFEVAKPTYLKMSNEAIRIKIEATIKQIDSKYTPVIMFEDSFN